MIELRRNGSVATLALAGPETRNALDTAAWMALADAAREAADARAVVLKSDVAGIFSSGADVQEFAALQNDAELRPAFRNAMRDAIDTIAALPCPVIAAIDGGCFGAGVALALAADIRVAGNGAEFAVTASRLGLSYPHEDVARLVAQVGRGMASMMLFTADKLRVDEAHKIGLVELKQRKAQDTADAIARAVAGNAPDAVRLLKRSLKGGEGLERAYDDCFGGLEFAEGLAAFRERRNPVWP